MARTHTFKGSAPVGYGYFAYIEDGQLVIGEDWDREGGILYKGPFDCKDAISHLEELKLKDRVLYDDIEKYFAIRKREANEKKPYINVKTEKDEPTTTSRPVKLCEIKITEGANSLKELVFQLTANGYRLDVAPVYKEFPKTGLDYWMIAIFDKEEK